MKTDQQGSEKINRAFRLMVKKKSCAKMARFNRYDAVNRSRQE
jgi:hypothetical protein